MLVSTATSAFLLCSSVLGGELFTGDVPPSPPQATNEAIVERLDRLEQEMATLVERPPSSGDATDCSRACSPQSAWSASVDWINWQVRQRDRSQTLAGYNDGLIIVFEEPVEFNRANGIRTSLSYQFNDGWQLGLIYSYLRPHGKREDEFPTSGEGAILRYRRDTDLDYDVLDLQLLQSVRLKHNAGLSLYGGVRWRIWLRPTTH